MWSKWLLCVGLFIGAQSVGKTQEFTDSSLQKCVLEAMQEAGIENASQLRRLKCHNEGIQSLSGIEFLIELEHLSLFANDVERADLRALKNLSYLNLAKNKLKTLQLTHLESLETLFLFNNELKQLDLSGVSSLKKFRMMQNKLVSLDLADSILLEEIYLWDNQLEDLDIKPLTNLKFMDVKQNPMPDELYDFFDQQEGMVISHDGNADDWK